MNDNRMSEPLIILEGPDGGGKTTFGVELAKALRFKYIHMSAMSSVGGGLAKMFVEAMMPALYGYQGVVMDRCWRSEPIYGAEFRGGDDRVGPESAAMLERIAARCHPTYVLCLPPVDACLETFRSRKGEEYLDTEVQLQEVYHNYKRTRANYDAVYDRTQLSTRQMVEQLSLAVASQRMHKDLRHSTVLPTVGWLDASVAIMGEAFGSHKDCDPLQQYPFVSFSGHGCSRWLTSHLLQAEVSERSLVWLNANFDRQHISDFLGQTRIKAIFALGVEASRAASDIDVPNGVIVHHVNHPQHAKRFRKPFELADQLSTYLSQEELS